MTPDTSYRWAILFVLFFARASMAFQYQAAAALSPHIVDSYLVTLTDIGVLIGLFLGPGVVVALAGGAVAARLGDRRVVALSLAAMLAGGLAMALGGTWGWLVAGRVLAGIGGVVVNVVMTKMLVDWFEGREIGTAMGIFISSWPAGIALALLVLPRVAATGGLTQAWMAVSVEVAAALVLFLLIYRTPRRVKVAQSRPASLRALPLTGLALSGAIWALYNAALAMVFGFGPLLFAEQGLDPTVAGTMIGVFMVCLGVAVPLGGWLVDRTGERDAVIVVSLAVSAAILPLLASVPAGWITVAMVAAGAIMGLAAGPIMTLPGAILGPEARALGMGLYFTIYYLGMMLAPAGAGGVADRAGSATVAFLLGALMLGLAILALLLFRRIHAVRSA